MKQLDFTDIGPAQTADREARHDAFWGPLDGTRRAAASVACDFFSFAEEVNYQMAQHVRLAKIDAEKSAEAFIRSQMYARVALEKFRLFGRLTGCRDDAETTGRLDRLVAYSRKTGWRIFPEWWTKVPGKNTAYFINKFKINAGQYAQYLAMCRKAAEEKEKAKGKKKGGEK